MYRLYRSTVKPIIPLTVLITISAASFEGGLLRERGNQSADAKEAHALNRTCSKVIVLQLGELKALREQIREQRAELIGLAGQRANSPTVAVYRKAGR